MPLTLLQQSRLDNGLCLQCGAERLGPGCQARRCARCVAMARTRQLRKGMGAAEVGERRAADARRRERRLAEGICTVCGKPKPEGVTTLRCLGCTRAERGRNGVQRQRRRDEAAGIAAGSGVHWPVGMPTTPLAGGARAVTIALDTRAVEALTALVRRRRDGQRERGETVRVRDRNQTIRELLRAYRAEDGCPERWDASAFAVQKFSITFDAETSAILERLADLPHFGGSRSAVVRAVLVYAVEPPMVARASGWRASAGYGCTGSRYRASFAPRAYTFWPEGTIRG